MKWSDLLRQVGDSAGTSTEDTRLVLEALVAVSINAIREGDEVVIPGFLILGSRWQAPRTVRSVHSQRRLALDGRYVPRVRAGARLKAQLADLTPQNWRDPEHQMAWRLADTLLGDLELYHRDQVPDLAEDEPLQQVETQCADAFGPAWEQVRSTYERRVPDRVRSETHHLPLAARRRWAQR